MTQMVYDAFRKQRELNLMLGLQSNVEIGGLVDSSSIQSMDDR